MHETQTLRAQMVAIARLLHDRGWVANHDGNATARLTGGRFLATPTATSKRAVIDRLLIEVDAAGKRVSGSARPFGELGLHLAVYQRRPDVGAVIHAHPPHATAIACSPANPIEQPFIAEAVVSIGPWIPKLPFAMPGDDATRALADVIDDVDAALLGNHGVMAWGADLEQAFLRLELVEHLARVALLALPAGGVQPLPAAALPPLLQARARAKLGRAADAAPQLARRAPARTAPPAATAPAAPRTAPPPSAGTTASPHEDLGGIIREELMRVLHGRD